jgi:two-component sensor histidine kinase
MAERSELSEASAPRQRLWLRLMERRRSRRLSANEVRELRDAATRVPRRQLQIFLSLIDMQLHRGTLHSEYKRLLQLRCHIASRMIVEKHLNLGHLPGRVKLEVVLAEVCRCISEGYRSVMPQNHLYWRMGPLNVDRDQALAVALLLSESLAECMSFACSQPYQRRIDVALSRLDDEEAELTITDNCFEGEALAEAILNANPLPRRFALRANGALKTNGAPHFALQLRFPAGTSHKG